MYEKRVFRPYQKSNKGLLLLIILLSFCIFTFFRLNRTTTTTKGSDDKFIDVGVDGGVRESDPVEEDEPKVSRARPIIRSGPSIKSEESGRVVENSSVGDDVSSEDRQENEGDVISSDNISIRKSSYSSPFGSVIIPNVVGYDAVTEDDDIIMKKNSIRDGFIHCYEGYERQCFGAGQLKPVTGTCKEEPFASGLKLTTVDSMDTLLIMGLEDHYIRARESLNDLRFDIDSKASVFETNIRLVGGLITSYSFTKDEILLQKATELVDKLLLAFDTPTGIPKSWVKLDTGEIGTPSWTGKAAVLSELASLQMEFVYLSHLSKNPKYAQKSLYVYDQLLKIRPADGLYPVYVNTEVLSFKGNFVTAGALADSFYEYLFKLWLLTGKQDNILKDWWTRELLDIIEGLGKDIGQGMFYLGDKNPRFVQRMEHLTCYFGGVLALASEHVDDEKMKDKFLTTAKGIAKTCHRMYEINPIGLPCEWIEFSGETPIHPNPTGSYGKQYLMRPEAVETWFILWRVTKDPIYREWGWEFFQSIEKYTKTEYGYSGIQDATSSSPVLDDNQQSFFLAETMKYLYLLFSPDDVIPLDKFVFNTEAHPIPLSESSEIKHFLNPNHT